MPFRKGNKLWDNPKTRSTWIKKGERLGEDTEFKKGVSSWNKGMSDLYIGDKNPCWRGGITPKNKRIRNSEEYQQWRMHVFNRDDYTCQMCGLRGVELHADHVMPFSQYPDLVFEILNGQTLCVECHSKTPTFKGKVKHYQL